MNIKFIKRFLVFKELLTTYTSIPYNSTTRHKMRGLDGNNLPVGFSPEEQAEIKKAVSRLAKDLLKSAGIK